MTFPFDKKQVYLGLGYRSGKSAFIRKLKEMKIVHKDGDLCNNELSNLELTDNIPYVIGIPQGTRLSGLQRVKNGWQVWIAVKDKSINPSQWQGTYLLCNDDGSVLRIQNDIDPEEIFHVKHAD